MVVISLLRGINLGPHNRIAMAELRLLYESLGLQHPRTYIQSGNVVFHTGERKITSLAERISTAIDQSFGVKSPVVLRTISEWQDVIARNPFAHERDIDPGKLLVSFCSTTPTPEDLDRIRGLEVKSERLVADGREIFTYFPEGVGRSKLGTALMGKAMKVAATARNWSTVLQLMKLAQELDNSSTHGRK